MVQITQGGITFGQPKPHWWDYLIAFDDFVGSNGDPVDSNKWDTVTSGEGPANIEIIDIQDNQARLLVDRDDAAVFVELTLKTALFGGKIMCIISSIDNVDLANSYMYVGNATDGWTAIISMTDSNSSVNYNTATEAIYIGNNLWDVYVGNYKVQSGLSLPNGLKIKFRAETNIGNDPAEIRVEEVYIQS